MRKTVLVTGGAGFIGKHTVNVLNENNFNVIVADRKAKPNDIVCKYYQVDVTNTEFENKYIYNGRNKLIL